MNYPVNVFIEEVLGTTVYAFSKAHPEFSNQLISSWGQRQKAISSLPASIVMTLANDAKEHGVNINGEDSYPEFVFNTLFRIDTWFRPRVMDTEFVGNPLDRSITTDIGAVSMMVNGKLVQVRNGGIDGRTDISVVDGEPPVDKVAVQIEGTIQILQDNITEEQAVHPELHTGLAAELTGRFLAIGTDSGKTGRVTLYRL